MNFREKFYQFVFFARTSTKELDGSRFKHFKTADVNAALAKLKHPGSKKYQLVKIAKKRTFNYKMHYNIRIVGRVADEELETKFKVAFKEAWTLVKPGKSVSGLYIALYLLGFIGQHKNIHAIKTTYLISFDKL